MRERKKIMAQPFASFLNRATPKTGSPNLYGQTPNLGSSTIFGGGGQTLSELMRSTVSRSGGWTNHRIPVLIFPRLYYAKKDEAIDLKSAFDQHRMHLVFVMKEVESSQSFKREPLTTIVDLPNLNYVLAKRSSTESEDVSADYAQIKDILVDWNFFGVVSNEEGENNKSSTRRQSSTQRSLNVIVKGKCTCYNIWHSDITTGTKLFLILKKVFIRNQTTYILSQERKKVLELSTKEEGQSTEGGFVFQYVPYADKKRDYPPIEDIMGDDNSLGKVFYIGKVSDIQSYSSKIKSIEKSRDINKIVTSELIEIFVDHVNSI